MPTSAIGTRSASAEAARVRRGGFTLVEVLVVLGVIAIAVGAVIVTLPAPQDDLAEEARDFARHLRITARESVMSGDPMGIVIDAQGYVTLRSRMGRWQTIRRDRTFEPEDWHPDTVARIAEADSGRSSRGATSEARVPQAVLDALPPIRFDTTGGAHPVTVKLIRNRDIYEVHVAADAAIRVEAAS